MRIWAIIGLLSLGIRIVGFSQSITATGSWNATASVLVTEAGNDYNSNLTSAVNQTLVSVSLSNPNKSFIVLVQKQDVSWNSGLTVWIRKTGDGSCGGSACAISPVGTSPYLQLSATNQTLYTGTRPRSSVPIQYEIRGFSVLIPANSFTTNIVYTITEL